MIPRPDRVVAGDGIAALAEDQLAHRVAVSEDPKGAPNPGIGERSGVGPHGEADPATSCDGLGGEGRVLGEECQCLTVDTQDHIDLPCLQCGHLSLLVCDGDHFYRIHSGRTGPVTIETDERGCPHRIQFHQFEGSGADAVLAKLGQVVVAGGRIKDANAVICEQNREVGMG